MAMGKLAQFGKVVLKVYGNDHLPPHFHVIAPDFAALVSVEPVAILRGSVPADIWATVSAWAEASRPALIAEWNRCNPRFPIA